MVYDLHTGMSSSGGEAYRIARAALYGAVIASAWFALASLFIPRKFPVPVYYVPIIGATGGAAWHALGRVPLEGRVWYYCRWILVAIFGGLGLILGITLSSRLASVGPAAPPRIIDVLETLGMFVFSGIGLARYAERLKAHESRPRKHALVRVALGLIILVIIVWLQAR
jgi:hypothetical protein